MVKSVAKPQKSKIAEYVAREIDRIAPEKSQKDIATELGYERPNIISMWKTGATSIPLEQILPLAEALGVDPVPMFRLALEEFWPEKDETIRKIFGHIASEEEFKILKEIRKYTHNANPALTQDVKQRLAEAFKGYR